MELTKSSPGPRKVGSFKCVKHAKSSWNAKILPATRQTTPFLSLLKLGQVGRPQPYMTPTYISIHVKW